MSPKSCKRRRQRRSAVNLREQSRDYVLLNQARIVQRVGPDFVGPDARRLSERNRKTSSATAGRTIWRNDVTGNLQQSTGTSVGDRGNDRAQYEPRSDKESRV